MTLWAGFRQTLRMWPRLGLVVALVVALAGRAPLARAQSSPETLAPLRTDAVALDKSYRRARAKRNVGISLAVPGVALTLLGVLLIGYATREERNTFSEIDEAIAGAFMAGIGLALGLPGVVYWAKGQDEMDVVKWRRLQLAPLVSGRGIGFTF